MGYTHYWSQKRELTAQEWSKARAAVEFITRHCREKGIEVSCTTSPQVIRLDGPCETFLVQRVPVIRHWVSDNTTRHFGFCKTRQMPYDLAVCMSLLAFQETGAFEVTSDGGDAEWADARQQYAELMGDEPNSAASLR
jgi:hypothetical protein